MYAADYREIARNALRGKWKKMALLMLLAALLGAGGGISIGDFDFKLNVNMGNMGNASVEMRRMFAIFAGIGFVSLLYSLLLGSWVNVGLYGLGSRVLDGEQPRAGMLFPRGVYAKCVGMSLLRGLIVFLWSLLLIVPGIIANFRYAMADYILSRHPEMGAMEALGESKRLMQGRKGRLFCLWISFFGWSLLTLVPMYVLMFAVESYMASVGPLSVPILVLTMVLGMLLTLAGDIFVSAYLHMATVAFFRDAEQTENDWQAAGEQERARCGGAGEAEDAGSGTVGAEAENLGADATAAREMFLRYGCSRRRMREVGALEEYEGMHVDAAFERRWLQDYAGALMRRFDQESAALDEILDLSAEYALEDLLTRTLMRIERHVRQRTLPDAEILNMAGRVLALATSGTFDEHPDFVARRKGQVSQIADQLEQRLRENPGDGGWQRAMELVRRMCA